MSNNKIIEIASRYTGLTEIVPNAKWVGKSANSAELSKELCESMEHCGWQKGWPYCMAFVIAVYNEAYADQPEKLKLIKKTLTPSTITSFTNAKKAKLVSQTPTPGSIFIMQKGEGGTGHAGIVTEIDGSVIKTIEGNTSPAPTSAEADRNGDGIYAKSRKLSFAKTAGLHLIGFISLA